MKQTKSLGKILKERRTQLGLTQRALADQVAIKASHVAYIESGRRRPSLPLLERIATVLGLDRRELFVLAHPEAKGIIDSATQPKPEPAPTTGNAWQQFVNDRSLLARYNVTQRELKALKQLSLLGYVLTSREFLAILSLIRTTP
ncbi:MAG TPA: helix-turn-helix transcriptional regulator [Candidatus Binataceae bacterium]|nr:helix-turn-helix transcriptional regulator [Candidatus Binataceae bacterium]